IVAKAEWPLETLVRAYRASAPRHWKLIVINPSASRAVSDILTDLGRAASGSTFPLLELVERLARAVPDDAPDTLNQELKEWVNETSRHIGMTDPALKALRDQVAQNPDPVPPTNPHLFFALRPSPPGPTSSVQAWLWTDQYARCLRAIDDPLPLASIPGVLDNLV